MTFVPVVGTKAADAKVMPMDGAHDTDPGFDWDGFYAGRSTVSRRGGRWGEGHGQAFAKAGVVVTDDLLDATGGYGRRVGDSEEDDALLGAGVDFALAENMTARAPCLTPSRSPSTIPKDRISLGANFQF